MFVESLLIPNSTMKPSVPRGNKKKAVQPVIITTENVGESGSMK